MDIIEHQKAQRMASSEALESCSMPDDTNSRGAVRCIEHAEKCRNPQPLPVKQMANKTEQNSNTHELKQLLLRRYLDVLRAHQIEGLRSSQRDNMLFTSEMVSYVCSLNQ